MRMTLKTLGVVAIALSGMHCDEEPTIDGDTGWSDTGWSYTGDAVDDPHEGPSATQNGQANRPDHTKTAKAKVKVRQPMPKKMQDFRVIADGGTN